MAPKLAACGKIATSIAMGGMLILMLWTLIRWLASRASRGAPCRAGPG
jgi:hypothetical protein